MIWEPILWNTIDNQFFYISNFYSITNVLVSILLGQLLLFIGLFGIIRRSTSILLVLLSLELSLLGLNFAIIFLGLLLNQPLCLILSMMLLILSAVETAIGLSLVFLYYKAFDTTALKYLSKIRY
jgi:NADH:ubiquinone oxidoreductase subunit K